MILSYYYFLFFSLIPTIVSLPSGCEDQEEIDIIYNRLFVEYSSESYYSAETYLSALNSYGYWPDIDYSDRSITGWDPSNHYSRMLRMAASYVREDSSMYLDETMMDGIKRSLGWWCDNTPESDNWWWNDIGQGSAIGKILILLKNYLGRELKEKAAKILKDPAYTGQNLVDMATQTIQRGCVMNDEDDIILGVKAIANEIATNLTEGIKIDGTFYQHGKLIHNGSYGRLFVSLVGYWIHITRETIFSFPEEKIKIFSDFVLDGTQWMIYGSIMDHSTCGRAVSRRSGTTSTGIVSTLQKLSEMESLENRDEFRMFYEHINLCNITTLVGVKYFFLGDFMVRRGENSYFSLKMCSSRTVGTESINAENQKAWFLPFGNTILMNNKNCNKPEYFNVYPLWNWARIPGTTSPETLPSQTIPNSISGTTDFVGGVTDGKNGIATMDYNYRGVTGKKAWFIFGKTIINMGAGIKSNTGERITTSINQCFRSGKVSIKSSEIIVYEDDLSGTTLDNVEWIFHDEVGYIFPDEESREVKILLEERTENWIDIGLTNSEETDKVFDLWIDHGVDPDYVSYTYISVVDRVEEKELNNYIHENEISILQNINTTQVVKYGDIYGIIFHQPQEQRIDSNYITFLGSTMECIILFEEFSDYEGKKINLTVSNPNPNATITLFFSFKKNIYKNVTIITPCGDNTGNSVSKTIIFENNLNGIVIGLSVGLSIFFIFLFFVAVLFIVIIIIVISKKKE